MQLSKRLHAVASMITPGNKVADIGCDHAYIPIYLVEHDISPHVIAMDVNQGPIDRARENIKRYGYDEKIETRKSNGLEKLQSNEADTILLAGMGGDLMVQILMARPDVLCNISELILQPQSEIYKIRGWTGENGFLITKENMLIDDGKYYVMMRVHPKEFVADPENYNLNKREHLYFGRLLLEERHPILQEYLKKEKEQCEKICHTLMQECTDKSMQRRDEILDKLDLIQTGMDYFV